MKLLILNHSEVEQLLPMSECISAMEEAFTALARGEAHQPLRTIFRPPEVKGVLAMMPTFRASPSPLFGLKAICVFPGNAAIGKDAHQGGVMLFDGDDWRVARPGQRVRDYGHSHCRRERARHTAAGAGGCGRSGNHRRRRASPPHIWRR